MPRKQISTSADIPLQVHETTPTEYPPGSEEKIKVLTARYANGEPMWHPEDGWEYSEKRASEHHIESFGEGILDDDDDDDDGMCDEEGGEL